METTSLIPKIIHYVWMGSAEKSELAKRCIESWKRFCSDYEIMEWNEQTFEVEKHPFVKRAVEAKNWASAADYIRLWALNNYGGIYLDADAEILKPLDEFLDAEFFIGYENELWLNPATFGSKPNHEILNSCLSRLKGEGKITFSTNPLTVHAYGVVFKRLYKMKLDGKNKSLPNGVKVYSEEYFSPKNYISQKVNITGQTFVLHHYENSWFSKSQKAGARFARISRKLLGKHIYKLFERLVARRFNKTIEKEFRRIEKERPPEKIEADKIPSMDD